ncbi:MAG: anaerobic glycerol-3-phosphate dehydrogenase subunit C, partial [Planctomycetota bacterium]
VERHQRPLQTHRVQSRVNRVGYQIGDATTDELVDLAKVVTGSEGTLALILQATLSTVPLPHCVGSVLFFFNSLQKAAEAAVELSGHAIRACDLMDRRHLSLARETDPRYELLIPQAAEAVLLVECEGRSTDHVRAALHDLVNLVERRRKQASGSHLALDPSDQQLLWQLARRLVPTLYRLRGTTRPAPYVEDIAVPPRELPHFLQGALGILRKRQITASLYGHAAHGQLHIRPLLDLADPDAWAKLNGLARELYEEVWKVGGTISGEHGEGLSRGSFISTQHGELIAAFREVKELFDPQGVLNPGRKVSDAATDAAESLRRITFQRAPSTGDSSEPQLTVLTPQFDWSPNDMTLAARNCNGCAACRTQTEDERMCPIFRYSPREEASPRAKANLARGVLAGSLATDAILQESCKQIADLCVHCHMCRLECPANVDVPRLMVEAKAQYVATNGQGFQDWLLTRIDLLCDVASRSPRIANWAFRNRPSRWLMERALGIAQGRKLPTFNRRPFLRSTVQRRHRKPTRQPGDKALLFVDTFANYFDAQLASAMVAILERNDVEVYIPDGQRESAMPMISQGVVEPARTIAERNVGLLAEAVRQGYVVVTTEPSAALAITREYRHLLGDDSDADLVADNTMDACHYLWRLHQSGRLQLDFEPLNIKLGYHAPCHVKALEIGLPTIHLLDLIPGIEIRQIERGCSGVAGLYGFKRQNYRSSLRAGLPLLTEMRTGRFQIGCTECSACRIQMEQGSAKPTIHPVKLVALAYGLMPEMRGLLQGPNEEMTVR